MIVKGSWSSYWWPLSYVDKNLKDPGKTGFSSKLKRCRPPKKIDARG